MITLYSVYYMLFIIPQLKVTGDMVIVSVHPSVFVSIRLSHFCPEHNSILLKLHKMIKDVERQCSL